MIKKVFLFAFFLLAGSIAFAQNSPTVYSSAKGTKYHTADCKLSGDADPITLAAAKKANKTACSICKPDDHLKDKTTQCTGKTADGTRCKRMTANASGKCFQHTPK